MSNTNQLTDFVDGPAPSPELPAAELRTVTEYDAQELRMYTSRFLKWHRKHYGPDTPPTTTAVKDWAREEGIDPETSAQLLSTIRRVAAEIIREVYELRFPSEPPSPRFNWTDYLVDIVKREKQLKEAELLAEERDRRPAEDERRKRDEDAREAIRAALVFRPLSCDSAPVKDLEWRLTTGNIPADEVQNVISFLNRLCRKESDKRDC